MIAALDPVLMDLALLFGLCAGVAVLFHWLKLPALVGFLAVGALVGPNALGLVQERELVQSLAEVGIVMLLFTVGLELSWQQILRLRRAVVVGGGLQVLGTVVLGAFVARLAGLELRAALFLGFLLTHSSTTAITKLLAERKELNSPPGQLAVAIAIGQDIAVVPMILVLPWLDGSSHASTGELLWSMGKALVSLAGIALAARFLAPRALALAARSRSREVFLLALFSLFLLTAIATASAGMSLALGAFLAGLVLAESEHHFQVRAEVEPLRDALASLFFVSIGTLVDLRIVAEAPVLVALALGAVVFGKALIVLPIARYLGYPTWIAAKSAFLLAQVGEFSFVLVQLARERQVLGDRLERIFLVVAALSIALTPLLFGLGLLIARRRGKETRARADNQLADHVVVIGYGVTGAAVGRSLAQLSIPFVAVEAHAQQAVAARTQGARVIVGDATRQAVLHAAGVDKARLVMIALNDEEATRRTVALCRSLAPGVRLVVRTGYLTEIGPLRELGVREIVPQELEASVEVLVRVLRHYLVADDEVGRQVRSLRRLASGTEKVAAPALAEGVRLGELLPALALEIVRVLPESELAGKTLQELGLPARTGCTVVAIRRNGATLLGLGAQAMLLPDDIAVLLGEEARIGEAAAMARTAMAGTVN